MKNQAVDNSVIKETKLSILISRIEAISHELHDNRNCLSNLSDRLIGSIPHTDEDGPDKAKCPDDTGVVGLLQGKVDELYSQVTDLTSEINRLADSGVV